MVVNMAGKGDTYRKVNKAVYDANYEQIFKKNINKKENNDHTYSVDYSSTPDSMSFVVGNNTPNPTPNDRKDS